MMRHTSKRAKALNYENIPLIAPSAIQKLLPSVGVVCKSNIHIVTIYILRVYRNGIV